MIKDPFIEQRLDKTKWRKSMTVGIAAICDLQQGIKFVFCADRQVTTFVKYEGMPKIPRIARCKNHSQNCLELD